MNELKNNKLNTLAYKGDKLIDATLPQTAEAIKRRKNRILRPAATIAIGASLFGAYKVYEANQDPTFSEQTITHTIQQGEGLDNVALDIEGIGDIDIRVASKYIAGLEANQEALKDGIQTGEQLVAPEKVESK